MHQWLVHVDCEVRLRIVYRLRECEMNPQIGKREGELSYGERLSLLHDEFYNKCLDGDTDYAPSLLHEGRQGKCLSDSRSAARIPTIEME